MSVQKFSVSLVIITLNEEKAIERCIRSVPFADEVIVVDSGSTDQTVSLAQKCGAKVINEKWRGYAKQKIFATEQAKNDWVLSLDADEALSPELLNEMTQLLQNKKLFEQNNIDAFVMPRLTQHLGVWLRHGGMYPDYQTRLFNKSRAHWLDTHVHEKIIAKNVVRLNGPIWHWSFENISHQIETINKYSSLRAQDFQAKGKSFSCFKMIGKMLSKFFECYVIKQGFRDGRVGLIVSVVSSFATFLRWAKLYELELKAKNDIKSQNGSKG